MKTPLLILCLSLGSLHAEESNLTPDEASTVLTKPLQEGDSASAEQYDAYRRLVSLELEGWEKLLSVLCDTRRRGDAARKIDSLWESSLIPGDVVDRFETAKRAEIARRSSNESWALLYAGAYIRTAHRTRWEGVQERLDPAFSSIGKHLDRPADALIGVAFLRVQLLERQDFPGHRFPWNEKSDKQKVALQGLLEWWKKHRDEFKEEE